ncbi:hypothetical protein HanXRQr2_Chr11g0483931 [Helianthus annuus]|uniref:Uncharacterized protein n=1 Tax=Helianthus annuus TaxID=4232 RepID=A0A9K3MZJ9_HELAN|nr:hypothetical protein HanXRQr2_Chr11g0483931 [Helianthus annuus]
MRREKTNDHVQKERIIGHHVSSAVSADGYHARVAAHAPDTRDVYTLRYSAFNASGSANVLSFQHMPGRSHQLPPTHTCPRMQQKATTLSNYKRHAVSLVYRTITHTACRFLTYP